MKRFVATVSLLTLLLLLLTSHGASAQATAELNGRVADESGAIHGEGLNAYLNAVRGA